MTSRIAKLRVPLVAGLVLGALGAGSANAAVTTTAYQPFATYKNAAPQFSSAGAGSSNLSFSKFNPSLGTLNSIKFKFAGASDGTGGAPFVNSNGLVYGSTGFTATNNSVVSISNINAQVALTFASGNVNGPTIFATPASDSFTVKTATSTYTKLLPLVGSYFGDSAVVTTPALLAAFQGTGAISTQHFDTIWRSTLTCTTSAQASCNSRVDAIYNVELGSQVDTDNAPSALNNDAWVAVEYDYTPFPKSATPGPLPLLGAGVAFGWAKRLRRRVSSVA